MARITLILVLTFLFIGNIRIQAKEKKPLTAKDSATIAAWDQFSVSAGGFLANLSSDILIGSRQLGLGLIIDLENALGLETSDFVFRGSISYRFGKRRRHSSRFSYFGFFRNATKVLEAELEIDDETYPIGTEIKTKFNLQIIKVTYDYSFFMDERFDLGVSIGLFVMPISFSTQAFGDSEKITDFTAPLPVLGIRTDFLITPKFTLKQSIHLLYLKIDNLEGRIIDLNFMLEYQIWRNFDLGFGINTYRLGLRAENEDSDLLKFAGSVGIDYTGLLLYAKYSF